MPTDRLARLRALVEQWRENANEIGPRLEGAAFEQCANQLAAELEGVLADPPQAHEEHTHYESGNCPHCGAWVNFAQEHEIEQLPAAPTPADGAPQED